MPPPVICGRPPAHPYLLAAFLLLGGVHAFVWGFLVSSVLVWHGSFAINSLAHLFGRRRYQTSDDSRNSFLLALAMTGEGWHNNHHRYPTSARQGFRWWEIDVTYYVLWMLARLGIIHLRDIRRLRQLMPTTMDHCRLVITIPTPAQPVLVKSIPWRLD